MCLLRRAGAHAQVGTFPPCPSHLQHKHLWLCHLLSRVRRHRKRAAVWDLLCCRIPAPFHSWGKGSWSDPASSSDCPGPHLYNTMGNSTQHAPGESQASGQDQVLAVTTSDPQSSSATFAHCWVEAIKHRFQLENVKDCDKLLEKNVESPSCEVYNDKLKMTCQEGIWIPDPALVLGSFRSKCFPPCGFYNTYLRASFLYWESALSFKFSSHSFLIAQPCIGQLNLKKISSSTSASSYFWVVSYGQHLMMASRPRTHAAIPARHHLGDVAWAYTLLIQRITWKRPFQPSCTCFTFAFITHRSVGRKYCHTTS